jgi:DNA topoisomerase-1
MVCTYLDRPSPKKLSKLQIEKGKKELLAIDGLGATIVGKLFAAGIVDADSLLRADAQKLADQIGITPEKIQGYQVLIRKKRDNAVIRI